jgi:uncharacterized protein YndB with AHSA1/START domain
MTSLTNDETSMGEVLHDGVRIGLRYVRRFDHPVERVWSAITESEQLRFWMPCDIVGERRAGADIKLPFWPAQVEKYQLEETTLTGRIEVWDPPTVFQWSWSGDILRFELRRSNGGTTMTFTTWLESPDLDVAAGAAGGYHVCLSALQALLDTGSAPPLVDSDEAARRLQSEYAKQLAAGQGSSAGR